MARSSSARSISAAARTNRRLCRLKRTIELNMGRSPDLVDQGGAGYDDPVVGAEPLRYDDRACVEEHDAVGDVASERHLVRRHEDRRALGRQVADELEDLAAWLELDVLHVG